MATTDAIRNTVETVLFLLRSRMPAGLVPSARITAATPDEFEALENPNPPAITVFLYRIALHSEMRNMPHRLLPDGRRTRPLIPLELYLMITPWAMQTLEELQILGRIFQVLYDRAEMGPADLQGASWEANDTVQLVFNPLPVEEHYRIWETTNMPYRLSLTYIARVVGLEPAEAHSDAIVTDASWRGGSR